MVKPEKETIFIVEGPNGLAELTVTTRRGFQLSGPPGAWTSKMQQGFIRKSLERAAEKFWCGHPLRKLEGEAINDLILEEVNNRQEAAEWCGCGIEDLIPCYRCPLLDDVCDTCRETKWIHYEE